MAINKNLKKAIGKIKLDNSINQEEVALKLEVHPSYLSDMINGRVPFTEQIANKIYEVFHIKVEVESEEIQFSNHEKLNEVNEPEPVIEHFLCPECINKKIEIDLWRNKYYSTLEKLNEVRQKYEDLIESKIEIKKETEASDSTQEWKDAK